MWNKNSLRYVLMLLCINTINAEDKIVEKKPEPAKKEESEVKSETDKAEVVEKKNNEIIKVNKVEIATLERFKPLPPRSQEVSKPEAKIEKIDQRVETAEKVKPVLNLFLSSPKEALIWVENELKLQNNPEKKDALQTLKKSVENKDGVKKEDAQKEQGKLLVAEKPGANKKLTKDEIQKLIELAVK